MLMKICEYSKEEIELIVNYLYSRMVIKELFNGCKLDKLNIIF